MNWLARKRVPRDTFLAMGFAARPTPKCPMNIESSAFHLRLTMRQRRDAMGKNVLKRRKAEAPGKYPVTFKEYVAAWRKRGV